jgi:tetratricopeptide (TPR) repeat protein
MRYILTIILLTICFQSYCETSEALTPEQTLQIIQDDTAKARLFKSIAESYITTDPETANLYADSGLVFVKKMNWKKGIGVFYNLKGRILIDQGKYKQAADFIQKAYETHKADKDDFNTASSLNNLGNTFLGQSNYEKSMAAYIEALKISEGIPNDYLIATCLDNIAAVYINQNNIDKALKYQFKSLAIKKRINDPALIATSHSNIANSYILKNDTQKPVFIT